MCRYKKFGMVLKEIMLSHDIRNITIADTIEVKAPFISMVLSGKKIFTPEQYQKLIRFLSSRMSSDDEEALNHLYYDAKMGNSIPYSSIKPSAETVDSSNIASTVGEQILLKSFRQLAADGQTRVINFARQEEINALDIMADNAELGTHLNIKGK